MVWHNIDDKLPTFNVEVLVWVDGHRNPSWKNNYALVAYLDEYGNWQEERHDGEFLIGIVGWTEIIDYK